MRSRSHLERPVNIVARKKIVFVIVEGPSDDEALGVLLSRIYDKERVYVHIMRKDITAENGVTSSNIASRIGDEIRKYASSNHFTKKDFREIIHLIDMDGAYAPDDCIIEDPSATKVFYTPQEIRTANKAGIEDRNRRKRSNINRICTMKEAWTIPYRVFYMSCNLDHVLYDKQNSPDYDKERDSYAFAKKYMDDIQGFIHYISDSEFSVTTTYSDSWEFIKQDKHSLERHTNLGVCFENV